ncbi:MAG TPA: Ldh family oxidoreductase [Alphaproteobacteria bacterium]
MVGYPKGAGDRAVAPGALTDVVVAIFRACGMGAGDAALLADTMVTADLRGVHSHGCLRVPDYVAKLSGGGADARGRPRVLSARGAAVVVDGGNAMGQIAAAFAIDRAIERAARVHVGVAAVGGSNHCGAMDYYAMRALPHDMIGIATTNALPTMAPWGGRDKILGINPLAIAVPAGAEAPLVIDTAFSASSHGKIRVFRQKGLALPEGWASDAEGRPTTDPSVAADGLLQPIGGYKGTGFALMMGILSTVLSGAAFGTRLGSMATGPKPGRDGHFLMAINIAGFVPPATFKAEVDGIIRELRASRPAPGHERVMLPGEREREAAEAYARDGIPLSAETIVGITAAAARLGVDATALT